ncbi:hypothetical protein B0F90DRAFT_1821667 [Multifurca ochricompacta]|uniref:Uncharacterized protein n=1 Tax=Multifurca ochricompacta TaxID=376703 RepID=A0AAD4QGL5_9AGAM|nr:hypothetical protein B0F90DRAFT_1825937 [Multifurca ochricompacta]KAI0293899.1 hypothetical protein B0F90DRAFT_1821667 [Multifurca ochricompacta]
MQEDRAMEDDDFNSNEDFQEDEEGNILDESDLTLLCAYALTLEECLTDKVFNKLCFTFPHSSIDSLKNTEKHIQFLSGFQPVHYHYCPSSCLMGQHHRQFMSIFPLFPVSVQYFDEELPIWFFSDPHDIALGLSADGFGPFKHHTKTVMANHSIQL